jgi:hypothetical protein
MTDLADPAADPLVSPDVLVFHGQPGWDAARRGLGLRASELPAAVAQPRSTAELVAVAEHARLVGLALRMHTARQPSSPVEELDGVLLVSLAHLEDVVA